MREQKRESKSRKNTCVPYNRAMKYGMTPVVFVNGAAIRSHRREMWSWLILKINVSGVGAV